ncbi:hypothetical protein [Paraburkholderia sp.]|jgi:hypothetical protein
MMQPQPQQSQQTSPQLPFSTLRFAASVSSMRTVAFSLLVDRALSA